MSPRAERWKQFALRHVWILPILLVALTLRLASIGEEHLYGDEAEYSIVARYLSRDWDFLAYPDITGLGAVPFVSQPPLILYIMAASMKLLGPTDFAAILPSILFGVATVAAVYALGNRLGGRLVGLGAAGILAALPFHIEMSRRAMLDAGYVFFLVLTAYFCVAWLQDRSRLAAWGVGIATACAALSKLPGILAGPVVLLVFLVGLAIVLARKDWKATRETLLQGGIAAIPIAIGAALYLALLMKLNALNNLMLKLQWQLGRVNTEMAQTQEVTQTHRDWTWYFTDPHMSLPANLTDGIFPLAIVGLVTIAVYMVLRSERKPEHLVIPIFTGVLLAFFVWSDRKEGFYLLPLAPFAAVLVGYAADGLRKLLAWGGIRFTRNVTRQVAVGAMAIGIVLVAYPAYSAAGESTDDFIRGNDQEKYFGWGTKEAAEYIEAHDPDAGQYGTLLGRFSLHWYNEQDAYHWYIDHTFIDSRIRAGELKYIVYEDYLNLEFDRTYMTELIEKYNGKPVETFRKEWGEVTVYELHP